ncbi:hypothetical protein BIW11_04737 [Tropilaelaps mercedesae]|uniref:Hexosyltransferase n=1 Tax=Tropilaelaps mercedesae TaxID=418985 RepID=A0A1V9X290_9ACAR|nr:hypothetical protein BIW11_04737 [Tropilaelaps mercedesae]
MERELRWCASWHAFRAEAFEVQARKARYPSGAQRSSDDGLTVPALRYRTVVRPQKQCRSELLVIVMSAQENICRRQAIRSTWAKHAEAAPNRSILFVTGRVPEEIFGSYAKEAFPPCGSGNSYVVSGSPLVSMASTAIYTPALDLGVVFITGLVATNYCCLEAISKAYGTAPERLYHSVVIFL